MVPQNPETMPTLTSPGDAARSGLLGTILNNPQLRRQLGSMPADEKTIALSPGETDGFSHPSWKIGDSNSAELETFELDLDPSMLAAPLSDSGFVPERKISDLGSQAGDDIDYRMVGRLGAGGTGVVFQAHQRAVDREVAVKMLRSELAQKASSRERFLTEARVIGGMDHPNVIALHEVYRDAQGGLFYSMKRIDGTSWDQQIGEMKLSQNVDTLLRVADAIRYAHSRGLVHRDIKPENVMLGRFGEVLLADWGLAISHQEAEDAGDIHQSIGGTPAYMAPELASGMAASITFQTDVYLLGAILFQILTGHPPHHGRTLLECIHAAAHNVIRETEIEGELMDVALRAMQTQPKDRFADVDGFIDAIKDQRTHDESDRLVRRAAARVAGSSGGGHYEDYRIADALLAEAIDVWPGNSRAIQTRLKLQMDHAKLAADRGDLDLAYSIYEAAGVTDSDEAAIVQLERIRRDASRQQVSRYSALFTHSPEAGLLVQMSSGKIVESNLAFARLFGYTEDQVVGKPIAELNLWACPRRRLELVSILENDGFVDDFDARFISTEGVLIDVLIAARVVQVQGEDMLVSTIRDISIRKRAENELKQSRARLRDLQRMAGLATWTYDVATGKSTWSSEAYALAGRPKSAGAPVLQEYFEMLHPDDRPSLERALDAAIESGAAYELTVRQRVASGEYQRLLVRGQPIFDDEGKTIEIYGIVLQKPID